MTAPDMPPTSPTSSLLLTTVIVTQSRVGICVDIRFSSNINGGVSDVWASVIYEGTFQNSMEIVSVLLAEGIAANVRPHDVMSSKDVKVILKCRRS